MGGALGGLFGAGIAGEVHYVCWLPWSEPARWLYSPPATLKRGSVTDHSPQHDEWHRAQKSVSSESKDEGQLLQLDLQERRLRSLSHDRLPFQLNGDLRERLDWAIGKQRLPSSDVRSGAIRWSAEPRFASIRVVL